MKYLQLIVLVAALITIQVLIGGVKLVYGLPAYALLGVAGLMALAVPWKKAISKPGNTAVISCLLLGSYAIWRAYDSPVNYLARTDLFMIAGSVLAYLIAAIHFPESRRRIWFLWIMIALATVHVFTGVIQFKEGENYMLLPWVYRISYGSRASGFYVCPNHLAGLLEILGSMLLALCVWGRGKMGAKVMYGYAVLVCFAGIAITGSRGGYLSTTFSLGVFALASLWVVKKLRPRKFALLAVGSFFAFLIVVGVAIFLMQKSAALSERLANVGETNNMRLKLWPAAIEQWKLNPTTGTGSGTYLYYGRQFRSEEVQNDPIHVHNDYLELLCEYGTVGAVLMALFVGAHLFSAFRGVNQILRERLGSGWTTQSNELALQIGAITATFALLAHSVLDFNLHIPGNTVLLAFIFGFMASPMAPGENEPDPSKSGHPLLRTLAPAAAVVLLALIGVRPLASFGKESVAKILNHPTKNTVKEYLTLGGYCRAASLLVGGRFMEGEIAAELARVALRDSMWPECRELAQIALHHDPKNPDAFFYLGESQHLIGLLEEEGSPERGLLLRSAIQSFEQGLKLFPQDLRVLLKIARTYIEVGDFDSAKAALDRAVIADPNFGTVYAYLGYYYYNINQFRKSEEHYQKALDMGETEIALKGLRDIQLARHRVLSDPALTALFSEKDLTPKKKDDLETEEMTEEEEPTTDESGLPILKGKIYFPGLPGTPERINKAFLEYQEKQKQKKK